MADVALFQIAAPVEAADDGSMRARIVPFGAEVPYGDQQIRFERGGLEKPATVPLTIDHGDSVLDRIGVMTSFVDGDDGAYAAFSFADTQTAQDVRSLLAAGAVTDVSVGVSEFTITDGVMTGTLDHVSVVPHGRFGKTDAPSKVLSVHDRKEPPVAEETTEATLEVATYDDAEVRGELAELSAKLVEVAEAVKSEDPQPAFAGFTEEHLDAAILGAMDRKAQFALADVVGDLGTADASGLNPDWYWSAGIQQRIDTRRPLFTQAGRGPFPDYGLNMTSARVTQNVAVGSGKVQKAETATQALQVIGTTFPVVFHSGAVDVAYELIQQSSPAVLSVLRDSFLTAYAAQVNGDIATKAQAAGTHTGAALDTATYGGLVTDLITTSNLIEDATGMPGDKCAVTSAQWIAINALLDGDGRRVFAPIGSMNADGRSSLVTRGVDIAGVFVFRDPDAAVAIQFNEDSLKGHEKAPEFIQAVNVPNVGLDMGIVGATVVSTWPAGLYSYEI